MPLVAAAANEVAAKGEHVGQDEKPADNVVRTDVELGSDPVKFPHSNTSNGAPQVDEFGLPIGKSRRRTYDADEGITHNEESEQDVFDDAAESVATQQGAQPEKEKPSASEIPSQQDSNSSKDPERDGLAAVTSIENEAVDVPGDDASTQEATKDPQSPSSAQSPTSPQAKHVARKASVNPVSEWSHQRTVSHDLDNTAVVEKGVDELEWQEMPALATHRIYDDWGKVLAKEYDEVEDTERVAYGTLGGAGKGYSRVQMDEDAKSATSMDDNTAYLFKGTTVSNSLEEDDDEAARDPLSQMQTTKEILTEGQRVAYVGVVRLSLAKMAQDMVLLEHSKGARKAVELATEALRMWTQKIMVRLYAHMEIDAREQIMVEQLAEHGVIPSDLTPALMQNARIKNPSMARREAAAADSSSPLTTIPETSDGKHSPSPMSPTEAPPPAYSEQTTAGDLTIQNPADLANDRNIDLDVRWTVLCDLFLLLIRDSSYDARSRTLLELVGAALSVEWQEICRFEKRVTDALEMQEEAGIENWNEDEHIEARKKAARKKRLIVMGLCTVGGGLVIGLSAGLLAPVIGAGLAAGFTTIGITGTGTFLGGTGAAALIGTTGSLIGSHIGLKTSNRRTGAVKTFEFKPLYNNKRVNLILSIGGWMTGKVDDVRLPYSTVDPIMGDIYTVNWEPEMLQSTGQTIQILGTEALTQTIQQILGATLLSTLMAGLNMPLVLTKLSYLIDNPWTVSLARGDASGLILADSIIDRNLGLRPITLVGFSLGARVLFSCLKELARRGAVGLIQNVYMFGSPVVVKRDEYTKVRSIVSGRFVNAYATNDWILGYLFRATSGGIRRVAGLAKIDLPGIENVDVTETVPGHMAYRGMMPILLDQVGWTVESLEFTEIEDPDPDNHDQRQRELLNEIEEARRNIDAQPEKKGFKSFFSRKKASQKKSWETYDERSARVLEGDEKESEAKLEENANVLFDVDAIRREALALAIQNPADLEEIKAHLSVREIESTMPALKVTLPKSNDFGSSPLITGNGNTTSRPDVRSARSFDSSSRPSAPSRRVTLHNGATVSEYQLPASQTQYQEPEEAEVTLSFENEDTSYSQPSKRETLSPVSPTDNSLTALSRPSHTLNSVKPSTRYTPTGPGPTPPLSARSVSSPLHYPYGHTPSVSAGDLDIGLSPPPETARNPWNNSSGSLVLPRHSHDVHRNGDEDDADLGFGKERDVEMSFE